MSSDDHSQTDNDGFEWDEFDQSELFLVDKKANIKAELQIVTVPSDLQRNYLASDPESRGSADSVAAMNQAIAFQVSCVKKLDSSSPSPVPKKSVEEQLEMHAEKYANMIRRFPQLMHPTFQKGDPVHGVWHKIEILVQ